MEGSISISQFIVRQGEHSIEIVPPDGWSGQLTPKMIEMAAIIASNARRRKQIADTCKHDEGVHLHRGEEVCNRCWICPIPPTT